MTNQPNVSWPGWEVVRLIGRGSFGAVYEIRRNLFGEEESAALKVISIPPDQSDVDELYGAGFDDEGITVTFQSHMKSVLAEYSLMRKMNGHSNIVNCDDVSCVQHEDGFGWDIYIKMELLTPLLKSLPAGSVPEETVLKVAHDLCQALVLCKKHDIVHRDIKPQNIFVSPNGDYKLGDFGIAKTVEKTTGGTKVGTYRYMAPEVYNNQPYGSGADIYSLGLVLYQLLNERRLPFMPLPPEMPRAGQDEAARNRRLAGEAIPAPVHGSEELKAIVLKACAYDPKERFASAEEMLAAVKALMKEEETAAAAVAAPPAAEPAKEPEAAPEADSEPVPDPEPVAEEPEAAVEEEKAVEQEQSVLTVAAGEAVAVRGEKKAVTKKSKPILWIALAAVLALTVTLVIFIGGNTKPPIADSESSQNIIINQPTNNQSNNNQSVQNNNEETGKQDTQTPSSQNTNNTSQPNKTPTQNKNTLSCTSHTFNGGICSNCGYEWPYTVNSIATAQYSIIDEAGAWTRPYENNSTKQQQLQLGTVVTVVASTKNQAGNLWYKMDSGLWVYGGNLGCASHSYSGGICSKCDYEWPYTVTKMSPTKYSIIDQAGAWTRPYENNSTNKGNMPLGTVVTVVASTKNQAGNLWYKMDNGLWVYGGNLKKVS